MAPSKRKRGGSSGGGQDRNKEKLTIELLGDASSRDDKKHEISGNDIGVLYQILERFAAVTTSPSKCSLIMQSLADDPDGAVSSFESNASMGKLSSMDGNISSNVSPSKGSSSSRLQAATQGENVSSPTHSTESFSSKDVISVLVIVRGCISLLRSSATPSMDAPFTMELEPDHYDTLKRSEENGTTLSPKERIHTALVLSAFVYFLSRLLNLSDKARLDKCNSRGQVTSTPSTVAQSQNNSADVELVTSKTLLMHIISSVVVGAITSLVTFTQCSESAEWDQLASEIFNITGANDCEVSESVQPRRTRSKKATTAASSTRPSKKRAAPPASESELDGPPAHTTTTHMLHLAMWQVLGALESVTCFSSTPSALGPHHNIFRGRKSSSSADHTASHSGQTRPWWDVSTIQTRTSSRSREKSKQEEHGNGNSSSSFTSNMFSSIYWIQHLLLQFCHASRDTANAVVNKKGLAAPQFLHGTKEISMQVETYLRNGSYENYVILLHRHGLSATKNSVSGGMYSHLHSNFAMKDDDNSDYKDWAGRILSNHCFGVPVLLTSIIRLLGWTGANQSWIDVFDSNFEDKACKPLSISSLKKKRIKLKSSGMPSPTANVIRGEGTRRSKRNLSKNEQNEDVKSPDETQSSSEPDQRRTKIPGNVLILLYSSKILDLLTSISSSASAESSDGLNNFVVSLFPEIVDSQNTQTVIAPFPIMQLSLSGNAHDETGLKSIPHKSRRSKRKILHSSVTPIPHTAQATSDTLNDGSCNNCGKTKVYTIGACVMRSFVTSHITSMKSNLSGAYRRSNDLPRIIFGPENLRKIENNKIYGNLYDYFPLILPTMTKLATLVQTCEEGVPEESRRDSVPKNTLPSESDFFEPNRDFAKTLFGDIGNGSFNILSKVQNRFFSRLMVFGSALGLSLYQEHKEGECYDGKLLLFAVSTLRSAVHALETNQMATNQFIHSFDGTNIKSVQIGQNTAFDIIWSFICETSEKGLTMSNPMLNCEVEDYQRNVFETHKYSPSCLAICLMSFLGSSYTDLSTYNLMNLDSPTNSRSAYLYKGLIHSARVILQTLRGFLELYFTPPPHEGIQKSLIPLFDFGDTKKQVLVYWITKVDHFCGIFANGMAKERCNENNLDYEGNDDDDSLGKDFQLQRNLWSDHIKLSISMGRGPICSNLDVESSRPSISPLLDKGNRLDILTFIASKFNTDASVHKSMWPLELPAAVSAMLLSHAAFYAGLQDKDLEPWNNFLIESFILRFEDVFTSYASLLTSASPTNDERGQIFQLSDARLFTLALCVSTRDKIINSTTKLTDMLLDFVDLCRFTDVSKNDSHICEVSGFVARLFLVLSTIVDLVQAKSRDFASCVQGLIKIIGNIDYHHPQAIDQRQTEQEDDCSWYSREFSFLGLFADLECPSIPVRRYNTSGHHEECVTALSDAYKHRFNELLEKLFCMGFQVAPSDNCYLLFLVWNAAARTRPVMVSNWWDYSLVEYVNGPDPSSIIQMAAKTMIAVRDRTIGLYCRLHSDALKQFSSIQPLLCSSLTNSLKQGFLNESDANLLENSVADAVNLLENLSERCNESSIVNLPRSFFSALSSVLIHIEYLVSEHTVPREDCINVLAGSATLTKDSIHKHKKGKKKGRVSMTDSAFGTILENSDFADQSGEDDNIENDYEGENETRIEALARLHECGVSCLGAAPVHPDWLDTTTVLRSGIPLSTAFRNSEKVLRAIYKLGEIAYSKLEEALNHGFSTKHGSGTYAVAGSRAMAAFRVSWERSSEDVNSTHQNEFDFTALRTISDHSQIIDNKTPSHETVALLKKVFPDFEPMEFGSKYKSLLNLAHGARTVWCAGEYSAHIIQGAFHSPAPIEENPEEDDEDIALPSPLCSVDGAGWDIAPVEMRATGEWEWYLACCLPEAMCSDSTADPSIQDFEKWYTILKKVCDSLVSVSSLIRFCCNKGRGRPSRHPLASHMPETGYADPRNDSFKNFLPTDLSFGSGCSAETLTLHPTLIEVIKWLATISSDGRLDIPCHKACHVAAAHLVRQHPAEFLDLVGINYIKRGLAALESILALPAVDSDQEGQAIHIGELIQLLVSKISRMADSFNRSVAVKNKTGQRAQGMRTSDLSSEPSENVLVERICQRRLELLSACVTTDDNIAIRLVSSEENLPLSSIFERLNELIPTFVSMLCTPSKIVPIRCRCQLASLLCDMIEPSIFSIGVRKQILKCFDGVSPENLEELVKRDICLVGPRADAASLDESIETKEESCIRALLCNRLCLLLSNISKQGQCTTSIINHLLDSLEDFLSKTVPMVCLKDFTSGHHESVLNLLQVLASHNDRLFEVGSYILGMVKKFVCHLNETEDNHDHLTLVMIQMNHFLNFVLSLKILPENKMPKHEERKKSIGMETEILDHEKNNIPKFAMTNKCSYVETGGDFRSQHWYNCYTCGLLWDKGCCTICALVCHKDHDVGYSRKSSFFCDCGAGANGGDGDDGELQTFTSRPDRNHTSHCKCLRAVSDDAIRDIIHKTLVKISDGIFSKLLQNQEYSGYQINSNGSKFQFLDHCAFGEIRQHTPALDLSKCKISAASVPKFFELANSNLWLNDAIDIFHKCFTRWEKSRKEKNPFDLGIDTRLLSHQAMNGAFGSDFQPCLISDSLSSFLEPVRIVKPKAFNVKLSNDSISERSLRSFLSNKGMVRKVIVSDFRGRMVVAEPSQLIFLSALPLMNIRHVKNAMDNPLDRYQVPIIGKESIKFTVVGLSLNSHNMSMLLAWGTKEVTIFKLSAGLDKCISSVELKLDLEAQGAESYVSDCQWLPNSSYIAAVVCDTTVKFYDLKKTSLLHQLDQKTFTLSCSLSLGVPYDEVTIKAACFISCLNPSGPFSGEGRHQRVHFFQVMLLLDSGRLQSRKVLTDINGCIKEHGERYFDFEDGLVFPTQGLEHCTSGISEKKFTTLGDGCSIHYLHCAGILLYKCTSSALMGMKIDPATGSVRSLFEILPHIIPPEMSGPSSEECIFSGPYTHFQELGSYSKHARSSSVTSYRFACVGKSVKTNLPKTLLVEVTGSSSHVQELMWPSVVGNDGLGLTLSTRVEGLFCFSTPYLVGKGTEEGVLGSKGRFVERFVLGAIHSNGCIVFFAESHANFLIDYQKITEQSDEGSSSKVAPEPIFPLQIFEGLTNASESDSLEFGGSFLCSEESSATAKQKLSMINSDHLMSPNREGCTLTAKLAPLDVKSAAFSSLSHVIVAVRLLVGSSLDSIPSLISIMGRPKKLEAGSKRWYDLPMTDEEIYLSARGGCTSIVIGPSHDNCNPPIIDAVEIYIMARSRISFLKNFLASNSSQDFTQESSKLEMKNIHYHSGGDVALASIAEESSSLLESMKLLQHCYKGFSHQPKQVSETKKLLQKVVCLTALSQEFESRFKPQVQEVLSEIEPDTFVRQLLIDEGVLMGISEKLLTLKRSRDSPTLKSDEVTAEMNNTESDQGLTLIVCCLKAAIVVARERPENYSTICDQLLQAGRLVKSIAVDVNSILFDDLLNKSVPSVSCGDWSLDALKKMRNSAAISQYEDQYSVTCSLVELIIHEMAANARQQYSGVGDKICSFADFSLVANILSSHDEGIMLLCCKQISRVLDSLVHTPSHDSCAINDISGSEGQHPIAYQCDGCQLFPIKSIRYTLEGEDIDLCKKCFENGLAFAKSFCEDPGKEVTIEAKTLPLGRNRTLTCSKVRQMRPVRVEHVMEEQVKQARDSLAQTKAGNQNVTKNELSADEHKLQLTFKTETQKLKTDFEESQVDSEIDGKLLASVISDEIFEILLIQSCEMAFMDGARVEGEHKMADSPVCGAGGAATLMHLVLHLVLSPVSEDIRIQRGVKLATQILKKLRSMAEFCLSSADIDIENNPSCVSTCIGMSTLVALLSEKDLFKDGEDAFLVSPSLGSESETHALFTAENKPRSKNSTIFKCKVHGVPCARRKLTHGINKDRRFYVCGKDKKDRCHFFQWADEASPPMDIPVNKFEENARNSRKDSFFVRQMESLFFRLITEHDDKESQPLEEVFCCLLQKICSQFSMASSKQQGDVMSGPSRSSDDKSTHEFTVNTLNQSKAQLRQDIYDGVQLCRRKFSPSTSRYLHESLNESCALTTSAESANPANSYLVLQTSLDLLSRVASNSLRSTGHKKGSYWTSQWFSLLCEIISSSSSSSSQRFLAKRMLKKLCGGKKETYQRVRDHYVFAFQFLNVLDCAQGPIQAAFDVKRRETACSPDFDKDRNWKDYGAGDLLGVDGLVSEDAFKISIERKLNCNLNDLLTSAMGRGANWRNFCGLDCIPHVHRYESEVALGDEASHPPIVLLFWMSCCFRAQFKSQFLRLVEVALTSNSNVLRQGSSDRVRETNNPHLKRPIRAAIGESGSSPEALLFKNRLGLTVDQVFGFILEFVYRGQTRDIRATASTIALKLFGSLPTEDCNTLLSMMLGSPTQEIGPLGTTAVEYLELVQNIIIDYGDRRKLNVVCSAPSIIRGFVTQMGQLLRNLSYSRDPVHAPVFDKIDLSTCLSCQRLAYVENELIGDVSSKPHPVQKEGTPKQENGELQDKSKAMIHEQIRPASGIKVDSVAARIVSSEFATHIQLTHRLAVSEVSLYVVEPRGRLVKTIGVFFSPRTIDDASDLKTEEYAHLWQQCGTLNLGRGCLRASCRLEIEVVAANLKFQFLEFYEKCGGSRTSKEGLILTCPRCTRFVTNSHGVCGHCGEVAFQCRKCRHINYDRLDAFLCIECGHCSSGAFNFELMAGAATNATAILDNDDFDRTMKMMRNSMKRQSDIRSSLKKRLLALQTNQRRRVGSDFEHLHEVDELPSFMRRALLGEGPKSSCKRNYSESRQGISSSTDHRSDDVNDMSSAANRVRSLASLARQLRDSDTGDSDRACRREFIVRQALLTATGLSGTVDFFDDTLIDGRDSGILPSGSNVLAEGAIPDPLSRLVSNLEARVNRNPNSDSKIQSDVLANSKKRNRKSKGGNEPIISDINLKLGEAHKLNNKLKEAEQETYELYKRIGAWERLNQAALLHSIQADSSAAFVPVTCKKCAPEITLHLLLLAIHIIKLGSPKSNKLISEDFVSVLFEEKHGMSDTLIKLKRIALVSVATESDSGSRLVLNFIRRNLKGTGDPVFAEILGVLLGKQFPLVNEYHNLAMQVMENNYK